MNIVKTLSSLLFLFTFQDSRTWLRITRLAAVPRGRSLQQGISSRYGRDYHDQSIPAVEDSSYNPLLWLAHNPLFCLALLLFCVSPAFVAQAQSSIPKGERQLSIDITEAVTGDYADAFMLAKSVGMQVTSLSLAWDDLEPTPSRYGSDPNWPRIANLFYPEQGVSISLALTPIDTNNLRLPPDLADKSFDDPEVIERFKRLLDYVFSQIPDLELSSLSIGNEIDGYLGTDKQRWQEYSTFFREVSMYARSKRPGLIVGSKIGFGGLTGSARDLSADIIQASDVVMLTYYPLNDDFSVKHTEVVHEDFAKLVELFPDKPIYVLEAGYPSSPLLNSSERKQADFVKEIFKAWDTHSTHIKLLDFTWLHDISPATVEELGDYYGLHDEKFLAYLATLGLRTFEGQDKEAFEMLRLEAKQRGW